MSGPNTRKYNQIAPQQLPGLSPAVAAAVAAGHQTPSKRPVAAFVRSRELEKLHLNSILLVCADLHQLEADWAVRS